MKIETKLKVIKIKKESNKVVLIIPRIHKDIIYNERIYFDTEKEVYGYLNHMGTLSEKRNMKELIKNYGAEE